MTNSKSYFRDHFVLFLLTVNAFLAIFSIILIFLRLSSSHGNIFIVQYRSSLGVSAFKTGSELSILSLGVFSLLILIINLILSLRTYYINRHLAVMILSFGVLLTVLDIIVSNALLVLH